MTDEEGNLIGLEDYLNMLAESGEFSHRMNKPLESFASNLMDMLILPAIYEAITGYELFTGEDLSGLDRGLKVAGALVSALSYGMSLSHMCSSLGGITRDKLIAAGFKEITSTTATYWVGYTCDELGLPVPVCIVVATIAGTGVDTFLDPILFDGLDSYHVSNAPEAKKPEENFVYQDMDLNLTYEPGDIIVYIDEITVETGNNIPIENGPYIRNGKPYGRPGPTGQARLEFEQAVYNNQVGADGILREPYPPYRVIDWKPGEPRSGVVDFGHVEGRSYNPEFLRYKYREITLDELKAFQSNPENFRIEIPSSNRNHSHE